MQWTMTGKAVPELAQYDVAVKALMTKYEVRAASLAICKDGRLVLARGYTLAEPEYFETHPTTLARFASCSKMFTSVAIHQLIEQGKLQLTSRLADVLNLSPPPQMTKGSNTWDSVQLSHLLTMTSGLRPGFADLDKQVCDAFGDHLPVVDKKKIARYLMTFDTAPSDGLGVKKYRNTDFFLLTAIIEAITGQDYVDAIYSTIFRRLRASDRTLVAGSLLGERAPGEVHYEATDQTEYPSVFSDAQELVPNGYGNINLEVGVGVGGWVMPAAAFARFLAAFDFPDSNPLLDRDQVVNQMWKPGAARGWQQSTTGTPPVTLHDWGGILPGLNSYVAHRSDNVSISLWWNRDVPNGGAFEYPPGSGIIQPHWKQWHKIANGVASWPTHDLFPTVSIHGPVDGRRFDMIWTPAPNRRVMWGLSLQDLKGKNTELVGRDFRMVSQQSYEIGHGTRRYDAIWEPGTDGRPVVWGATLAGLKKRNDAHYAQGYRLAHQHSYDIGGGTRRYDAIWVLGTDGRPVVWGATLAGLKKRNDAHYAQGYRLAHQHSYDIGGGTRRYDAIWVPGTDGRPVVWGATLAGLKKRNDAHYAEGYRLAHQHSYDIGGGNRRYDAIWEPGTDGRPVVWGWSLVDLQAANEVHVGAGLSPGPGQSYVLKSQSGEN